MSRAFILAIFLALVGCSDSDKLGAAMKEFVKACNGPVSARFTASTYSNQIELSCAEVKPMEAMTK